MRKRSAKCATSALVKTGIDPRELALSPTLPRDAGEGFSLPRAARSGSTRVLGEIRRSPPKRPLHSVGHVSIATVEHLGEQISDQRDQVRRQLRLLECSDIVVHRHVYVADLPARGSRDLSYRPGERQQAWSCE